MPRSKGIRLAVKTMLSIVANEKSSVKQKIDAAKVIAMFYGKKKVKRKKMEGSSLSPLLGKG